MSARPEKILALQFKYFGDAVLLTPALRALRGHFPQGELHLLVPWEIAPIFQHLPWLDRVWLMPRRRGRISLSETWPVIRALRGEHFNRSVDFASNDRGAIVSLLAGARQRLGWVERGGFWGRPFCYNQRVAPRGEAQHESARLTGLLSSWGVAPSSLEPEIHADPALSGPAEKLLPERTVLCHVASSQPKKEWPLRCWAEFYRLAAGAGRHVAFTTATGEREQSLMGELKKMAPEAPVLPAIAELPLFLAVLKRARVFVSGDTGPLHFAAGLGVPTIALFGPSSAAQWAPVGKRYQALTGSLCGCDGDSPVCYGARHCLAAISPEEVFRCLEKCIKETGD